MKWFTPRGGKSEIQGYFPLEKFKVFVNERSIPFRQLDLVPNDKKRLVPLLTQLDLYKALPTALNETLKSACLLQKLIISRRDVDSLKGVPHPELLESLKIVHDPNDVFCSFSLKDLIRFKNLKKLKCKIELANPGFTEKQLQAIGGLTCLEYLDLSGNTLDGVDPLARLTRLTSLHLSNTSLKKEDISLFSHFEGLKTLVIAETVNT